MLKMKKILVSILLFANLCSGLAFAIDVHHETMMGHNVVDTEMSVLHDHSDHDNEKETIDHHCCHGAAHVIALISPDAHQVFGFSRYQNASLVPVLTSLYIAPLLRPPII